MMAGDAQPVGGCTRGESDHERAEASHPRFCFACAAAAGALCTGVAYAADPRLDEADAAIQKAIGLLEAARNPDRSQPAQFGGHRTKAIHDLEQARQQIAKAKASADKPAQGQQGQGQGKDKS